ncbi:hypothetical protein ACH4Y0_02660 [Streptomyces sp. NPDC020707]|uniref:hypothetical protein n=1 Tax=Streptomyces sp. NPDC020707 TaxID=3365084 RepID=UPI0037BCA6C4
MTVPSAVTADRDRLASAIRDAACPGDCGKTEEECAKERIQPFVWHHGRLAVVEGTPEQFAAAVLAVLPEPTDRAALLIEAADELDAYIARYRSPTIANWTGAVTFLRRLATEAQPTTEAHPAEHSWRAELHDPLADEWAPGTRYVDRDRAVNALAHARSVGPTWRDGTPTRRRLVRVTTTYTVEPETEPAAGARQDGAQTQEEPDVVAYRYRHGPSLRCLAHPPHGLDAKAYEPVTSEDLPDGGTCTFASLGNVCGMDVLAPQKADRG